MLELEAAGVVPVSDQEMVAGKELSSVDEVRSTKECAAVAASLGMDAWFFSGANCNEEQCDMTVGSSGIAKETMVQRWVGKAELMGELSQTIQAAVGGGLKSGNKPAPVTAPIHVENNAVQTQSVVVKTGGDGWSRATYLWTGWTTFGIGYVGQVVGTSVSCSATKKNCEDNGGWDCQGCVEGQEEKAMLPVLGALWAAGAGEEQGGSGALNWGLAIFATAVQIGGLTTAIIGHTMKSESSGESGLEWTSALSRISFSTLEGHGGAIRYYFSF